MPSKDTKVLAVRTTIELAKAVEDEAAGRDMSVNELLNVTLAERYKRGSGVRKVRKNGRKSNAGDDTVGGQFE